MQTVVEATAARLAEAANLDAEDDGIEGAPDGWQPPGAPIDWAGYVPKGVDDNEPVTFEEVDNPGHWSDFTFRPKCKGTTSILATSLQVGLKLSRRMTKGRVLER